MTSSGKIQSGEAGALPRPLDSATFNRLVEEARPKLRAVVQRLVGHPDDTDEVVQEALLRAWSAVEDFRGKAAFSTWLCAIGMRASVDFLRTQKKWRPEAQIAYSNKCASEPALSAEVIESVSAPEFSFEVREHIGYCFTCVGRSLEAEEQAALVLRDVFELSNREAAKILGFTESVLRHRLSAARGHMTRTFDGLCSLVNKAGICYQCRGLRQVAPEARRGGEPFDIHDFAQRLAIVRDSTSAGGGCRVMHDLFWRRTKELEMAGDGSIEPESDCGRPDNPA